tara:strand:+ start:301 stop:765 length:465 start_codon:yes stop_codon:yes gene_type:complete
MAKILKSVSSNALYSDQTNKAQKIINDKNAIFGNYTYLADNEEVYIVEGEQKEWVAYRCTSPFTKNKTNFYDMVYECKPTGEVSEIYKTKKELTTAIETDTITWKEWDSIPKVFRKTNKVNKPNTQQTTSSKGSIPFWVWIVVGVLIVFVIASL